VTIDPEATNESFIDVPIDLSGFKDFGEARLSPASFNRWYRAGHGKCMVLFTRCFELFLIHEVLDFCVSLSSYAERSYVLIVLKTT
jgi:hypothetical protein